MEGRGLVRGSCLYDACYTPGSEHSSNDEMAMQFRYPFEIMVPWHMEDRAAEAVPCIVLCFGNGQKQGNQAGAQGLSVLCTNPTESKNTRN